MIDGQAGAVLCNQCFTEGNEDFIAAVAHYRSGSVTEALRSIADYLGREAETGKPAAGSRFFPPT